MRIILFVVLFACLTGCGTFPGKSDYSFIQELLDAFLPKSFVGDVHIGHKNPYFDGTLDVGNLHTNDAGTWEWTWLVYHRGDRFSSGEIRFGTAPRLIP